MTETNKHMAGISISQEEKAIVDTLKVKLEISFSKALGIIIREWSEMKKQYVTVPISGIVKADGVVTMSEGER